MRRNSISQNYQETITSKKEDAKKVKILWIMDFMDLWIITLHFRKDFPLKRFYTEQLCTYSLRQKIYE